MSDVICERCGFRYGAEHTKEDGTYSCPLCEVTQLEAERDDLLAKLDEAIAWHERDMEKAIELLIGWLISDDDVDMVIHTDRWLRNKCNCENELPPCKICEVLEAGGE